MALSRKMLGEGEDVLVQMRTHPKALVGPVLVLVVVVAAAGTALGIMPPNLGRWAPWAVIAVAAVLLVVGTVVPWLRWLTSTYTITSRRVIARRGILTRSGHDLPLNRINDVSYERGILDRIVGCGTLIFTTAAGDPVTLPDVPRVEQVQLQVSDLIAGGGTDSLDSRGDDPLRPPRG